MVSYLKACIVHDFYRPIIASDVVQAFASVEARSFGPALFVGGDALANVWVFLVAPLVGGVLAALVYKFLDSKKAE